MFQILIKNDPTYATNAGVCNLWLQRLFYLSMLAKHKITAMLTVGVNSSLPNQTYLEKTNKQSRKIRLPRFNLKLK